MCTVRCSGHLLGGEVSAQEGVCPGGCLPRAVSAQGVSAHVGYLPSGVCLPDNPPP